MGKQRSVPWLVVLLLAFWLGGSSVLPAGPEPLEEHRAALPETRAEGPSDELYWWYVRFRVAWPEGEDAPWHPDLWLADRVLGPVLDEEADAIALWRFDRRAARDGAGRQFSFIFRANPETAARVNGQIRADAVVRWMQADGLLEAVVFDDPARPSRPGIGDTSDPAWTPAMQRAWPHFVMGVSRLWLELIRELDRSGEWPSAPEARYAAISDALDTQWRNEGGHALLHHLNAVFGYTEVQILSRELLRF